MTKALFGLPEQVVFCKRCVISNQRPNSTVEFKNVKDEEKATINFDEDEICDACRYQDSKASNIDWEKREKLLCKTLDSVKSIQPYNCLVAVSGGKDGSYVSYNLKQKYGMNPLTVTVKPGLDTDIVNRNLSNFINEIGAMNANESNIPISRIIAIDVIKFVFP